MTAASPRAGLTIPLADGSDDADLAALLRALGLDVENKMPGVTAMTTAARTALIGAPMFVGRAVYDINLDALFLSNGTAWRRVAAFSADGTLPAGSSRVVDVANGTAPGDAVNRGQLDAAVARVVGGSATVPAGSQTKSLTLTPPAGLQLKSVIPTVNTVTTAFLWNNGYAQVMAAAQISNAGTGACAVTCVPVTAPGGGVADPTGVDRYVMYMAVFG